MDTDGKLGLAYVHPRDRGLYSCLATNTAGTASRSLQLEVKVRLTSSVCGWVRLKWLKCEVKVGLTYSCRVSTCAASQGCFD